MKLTIPIFQLRIGIVWSEVKKFGQVQTFIEPYVKNFAFLSVASPPCSYHLAVKNIYKASDSNVATMYLLEKV